MPSSSGSTLVLISASCVTSNKLDLIHDAFSNNDSIKILNTTNILLTKEQHELLPVPDVSEFCNGSITAYLLQSDADIDFEAIEKSAKLSKAEIFKTQDQYFVANLKQIFFPQKQTLEQTLILCNPSLSEEHLNEINEELKLKGIFILFEDGISSESNSNINNVFNDEEKQETVHCTAILCESFGCIDQIALSIGCDDTDLFEKYAANSWNNRYKENSYKFIQISDSSKFETFIPKITSERTLALIKPTAVTKGFADSIINEIKQNGFTIIAQKRVHLKVEHAQYFYKEHEGKAFFDNLTSFMSSGSIYAFILERIEAIKCWRTLLGPTNTVTAKAQAPQSLRARYGTDQTANACHGSDSVSSAQREIRFYFPEIGLSSKEINGEKSQNIVETYMEKKLENDETLKGFLIRGLSELAKKKPGSKLEVVEWFGRWLLDNNPNKPMIEELSDDAQIEAMDFISKCKHLNGGNDLKIIFVCGGPGSGKGTQCKRIVEKYGFIPIGTGDLCRKVMNDTTSSHSADIKEIMENGELVPTELLLNLMKDEMLALKGSKYLLDGFPRSLDQCIMFEKEVISCNSTLNFVCNDDILSERCLKRGEEKNGGRVDDNKESIKKRLETFHDETDPTIEYLKSHNKVKDIDASNDIDKVWNDVEIVMDSICR